MLKFLCIIFLILSCIPSIGFAVEPSQIAEGQSDAQVLDEANTCTASLKTVERAYDLVGDARSRILVLDKGASLSAADTESIFNRLTTVQKILSAMLEEARKTKEVPFGDQAPTLLNLQKITPPFNIAGYQYSAYTGSWTSPQYEIPLVLNYSYSFRNEGGRFNVDIAVTDGSRIESAGTFQLIEKARDADSVTFITNFPTRTLYLGNPFFWKETFSEQRGRYHKFTVLKNGRIAVDICNDGEGTSRHRTATTELKW